MSLKEFYSEKFWYGQDGLTFDDILIVPGKSEVIPAEVNTATQLSSRIRLNVPVISAAMDTVTDSRMAIAMAQLGGLGIIHRNYEIDKQAEEVRKVKRFENIFIRNPITLTPDKTIREAKDLMKNSGISGIPIVDDKEKLVGILTHRDLSFYEFGNNDHLRLKDIMTPRKNLVTAKGEVDLQEAGEIMRQNRVEKLPVINDKDELIGLITLKDITQIAQYPSSTKDERGRLQVGAGVGTGPHEMERVDKLIEADVDLIVIDTAHGHSKKVLDMVQAVRKKYPQISIMGGNIATADAARDLIKAGVDCVKVGIGPGSICTTRVVAGVGVPQISAIMDVYSETRNSGIPVVADGGIKFSGDIAKALAAGADTVMLGNLLAGTTESPGEFVIYKGRRYKSYRGMGSIGAMNQGSKSRYFQDDYEPEKLVPEGIEGRVHYKGDVKDVLYQLVGGLRAAMGYTGSRTIPEFKTRTRFIKITAASLKESHPHDVVITKESPNYMVDSGDE